MIKVGSRVTNKSDPRSYVGVGEVTRSHDVNGAWYVKWPHLQWNCGHYEHDLVLVNDLSPLEVRVVKYCDKELGR